LLRREEPMTRHILTPGRKPRPATHVITIGDGASVHRTIYLACADRTASSRARAVARPLTSDVTVYLSRICPHTGETCRPMLSLRGAVDPARREAARAAARGEL
jgi:hypothetical protein